MSLFYLLTTGGTLPGAFDITNIDGTYTGRDADGFNQSGNLVVNSAGEVNWTGDAQGTNEFDDWWLPNNTVQGTWHTRLTFDSGTNVYSSGDSLATWIDISTGIQWNFSKTSEGGPVTTTGNYTLSWSDDAGSTTHDSVALAIRMIEQSP